MPSRHNRESYLLIDHRASPGISTLPAAFGAIVDEVTA